MKKFIKVLSLVLVVVLSVTFLTGCSKCNQKYADKINEKAEQKKWVTYEKVMKDLGDEAEDTTVEVLGYRVGAITLIEEKGKLDAPGRPILFGTTDAFLRCFGLESIDDLPKTELQMTGEQVSLDLSAENTEKEQNDDTPVITL